jgi:hypothetical protein
MGNFGFSHHPARPAVAWHPGFNGGGWPDDGKGRDFIKPLSSSIDG